MSLNSSSEDRRNIRILVAEDNESNYELLQVILRDYTVERAGNGREVVDMARSHRYSIIFMDLMMPQMDGLESTRQIRAFDMDIPIIAVTANVYSIDENESLRAGCTAYLSKPIRKSDILEIMDKYVLKNRCEPF